MIKLDYDKLLQITSLNGYPQDDQLQIIGLIFDYSSDRKNITGVEKAFKLSEEINFNQLTKHNQVLYSYYLANGWSHKAILGIKETKEWWDFQLKEFSKQILHLRKAIALPGFKRISKQRKCQIYTNIASLFNSIGRTIEALEYWEKALSINPSFAMALANKGRGLYYYGGYLYNHRTQHVFIVFSYHNLKKALELKDNLDSTRIQNNIESLFNKIENKVPEKYRTQLPDLNSWQPNKNKKLVNYRKWVLKNTLFINPLNDLGGFSMALEDNLTLPPITIASDVSPTFILLFNQIKQEFASARYIYYNATRSKRPHYSDLDVILSDADDPTLLTYYPDKYSFNIEQLKMTFRASYSILNKIAYLLNDYLRLDPNLVKVDFKNLWYKNDKKLKSFFQDSDNIHLRGLYWLSKDLYERDNEYQKVIESEAREIETIRHYIEHKAFRVFDKLPPNEIKNTHKNPSYIITRKDFEQKTLKLLKLTRAAIMYTPLAIHHEERKKPKNTVKTLEIKMQPVLHSNKK